MGTDLRGVHLYLGGHFERLLRGCGRVGIVFGGEVPGEQFVDPVDRLVGDAGQDSAEIAFWASPLSLAEPTSE
jgi:hypothetical protein